MTWVSTSPGSDRFDNILSCHSLNPAVLRAHSALYRAIVCGDSPLTRVERGGRRVRLRRQQLPLLSRPPRRSPRPGIRGRFAGGDGRLRSLR